MANKLPNEIRDREGKVIATFTDIHADRIEVLRIRELLSWLEAEKLRLESEKADALTNGTPQRGGLRQEIRLRGNQIFQIGIELGRLRRVRRGDFDGVSPSLTMSDMDQLKTPEQCVAHLNLLKRERDELKTKIDEAIRSATEGGMAVDSEWLGRAERAYRNRRRKISLVQQLLERLRDEQKGQQPPPPVPKPPGSRNKRISDFNTVFLDVAREHLAPDVFDALIARTKDRVAEMKSSETEGAAR